MLFFDDKSTIVSQTDCMLVRPLAAWHDLRAMDALRVQPIGEFHMSMRLVTAATAAALLLASSFAVAGNITFTVQNESGATMTALYGGPSSQDDWGGNILSGRIPPGAELVVTISDARACEYDFRYEFSDKESYEEYGVDICEIDGDAFVIQ